MRTSVRVSRILRRVSTSVLDAPMRTHSARSLLRIKKNIAGAALCLLFSGIGLFAQTEQVFKGKICVGPEGRTPVIENGESSLPCMVPHPKKGTKYILFNRDNKTTFHLDGHPNPRNFMGRTVVVLGTLEQGSGTIQFDDIFDAVPPKVMQAKSVYIDCDNCVRGMAAAWRAAFEELTGWGRFDINPDPKMADVIFLYSANPYLGDYVTRDGPDKRGVKVDITYMNVVDPQTGKNLWEDSRHMGSLFVAKATRELIDELKLQMEEQSQTELKSLPDKHRKAFPTISN